MQKRTDQGERKLLQYYLVVASQDGAVETHLVTEEPITVGRSPLATICVPEVAVSRQHCVITYSAGRLTVLDQGSTNGTFVNGTRVKQARLAHSDIVQVGSTRLRVQAQTARSSASMRRIPTPEPDRDRAPLPHEQVTLLEDAARRLASSEDLVATGRTALALFLEGLPVERAYIILKGGVHGPPQVVASRNRAGEPALDLDPSMPVVERVLGTGQAERHLGLPAETAPAMLSEERKSSGPVLCAPLRAGTEVFGAVYLSAERVPEWVGNAEVLSLFSAQTDLVAMALGRARVSAELREQSRLARDRQSELSELGRSLEQRVKERTEVIEEQRIELAARLEELEHLQESREVLARALVHDIRNLVAPLDSNLAFVRSQLAEGDEAASALDDAAESGRRIVQMAEDVLAVSRMEDGTFPLAAELLDACALARDAVRRGQGLAREVGASLEVGPLPRRFEVSADPQVLGRVLDNLVGNALRHAGPSGLVSVWVRKAARGVDLVVSDSGPGIEPQDRARLFTEWFSAGARSGRHHGIGLHFCRLAAEAHGGSIAVEGSPGDNRFVVTLPSLGADEETGPTTEVPLD